MSIIAISGKMGAGKSTVGEIIDALLLSVDTNHQWELKSFAGKLKQTASLLTGIPVEKWEDQEFKKQEMSSKWWYKNVYDAGWDKKWTKESLDYPTHTSTESHIVKTTYRQFLQNLGTEAMREGLHANVWVNALFADYRLWSDGKKDWYPNWIITDMRFPNEYEAVKSRNGITIRVIRPNMHSLQSMIPEHPSETALDDTTFDYEIINDGTIKDLVEKVREILTKENLI